jgi:hypothetical protein
MNRRKPVQSQRQKIATAMALALVMLRVFSETALRETSSSGLPARMPGRAVIATIVHEKSMGVE